MDEETNLLASKDNCSTQEVLSIETPKKSIDNLDIDKVEDPTKVRKDDTNDSVLDKVPIVDSQGIYNDAAIGKSPASPMSSSTLKTTVSGTEEEKPEASKAPVAEIDNLRTEVKKGDVSLVASNDVIKASDLHKESDKDENLKEVTTADMKRNKFADGTSNKEKSDGIDSETCKGDNGDAVKLTNTLVETNQLKKGMLPPSLDRIAEIVETADTGRKKLSQEPKHDADTASPDIEEQKEVTIEKHIIEPENTEFVQISQDKQDDVQSEGQPMEAEDPFGEGNLTIDTPELDSPIDGNINFRKLGDQADNLQDVVNAKDTNFKNNKSKEFIDVAEESNVDDSSETNIETSTADTSDTNVDASLQIGSKVNAVDTDCIIKTALEKSGIDQTVVECENENSKKKKTAEDVGPMDTDEAQSAVLPGQDDELCIIPDSMKETTTTSVSLEKPKEARNDVEKEKSSNVPDDETTRKEDISPTNFGVEARQAGENISKEKESNLNRESPVEKCTRVTDVIDIDDDLKNSEIEDISSKDTCKQCNEQKSSNITVRIGTEHFNVCSESCKIAFTEENNKAMDIPSDGVNSKREKRCAGCLLIVEAGDERNLSWETMEFCNEECLAKFQTKYGSYCRNCNGAVQPISLGKYCVRFGYDVRQFCCSTCLEEFKKGLKVCSYCQKDISSGTEGFLAPVGDKGQFKDFCTQYCMEKYSRMNSTEPPSVEIKACSVCQEVRDV